MRAKFYQHYSQKKKKEAKKKKITAATSYLKKKKKSYCQGFFNIKIMKASLRSDRWSE
jgi:hypothetical protein